VIDIRDQVKSAGLPFMFKHWPGKTHNAKEALLEGKIWKEYPTSLLKNINWQWESLPGNSKRPHYVDHESCCPWA